MNVCLQPTDKTKQNSMKRGAFTGASARMAEGCGKPPDPGGGGGLLPRAVLCVKTGACHAPNCCYLTVGSRATLRSWDAPSQISGAAEQGMIPFLNPALQQSTLQSRISKENNHRTQRSGSRLAQAQHSCTPVASGDIVLRRTPAY